MMRALFAAAVVLAGAAALSACTGVSVPPTGAEGKFVNDAIDAGVVIQHPHSALGSRVTEFTQRGEMKWEYDLRWQAWQKPVPCAHIDGVVYDGGAALLSLDYYVVNYDRLGYYPAATNNAKWQFPSLLIESISADDALEIARHCEVRFARTHGELGVKGFYQEPHKF